ncbi:acyl-protein thioesterase 1 [Frankliniella occidentalis]|uniref:palmitoyl-protein hydrolase n=1 Tax=Frankliniella occidentalis TaxID=133901 RepID=A0A6J1RXE1_FRAOC|nr:acyl-protein thioesterase 1 [Frankliniella occidentalis]
MTKKHQNLSSVLLVKPCVSVDIKVNVFKLIVLISLVLVVRGGVIDSSFDSRVSIHHSTLDNSSLNMAGTPVVIGATAKHTATLIFLHGLGDTGHGWASAMGALKTPFMKVICPTAQTIAVTLNSGFKMPAWFDLKSLDASGPEDESGIKKASQLIHSMIDAEVSAGIPSNRIVIGGFSQGGALALYSALTYSKPLAGVVALSCWLPLNKSFPSFVVGNKETPFLQCHGDCDPIVPFKWGQMTASILKGYLKSIEFKTYGGLMHSSSDEEMNDIKDFVQKQLPNV